MKKYVWALLGGAVITIVSFAYNKVAGWLALIATGAAAFYFYRADR